MILFCGAKSVKPQTQGVNKMSQIVTSQQPCGGLWISNEWLRMSNSESNHIVRESLKMAIMQLMADKPLAEISITELVKRAGVSRSAFYRNYGSKENLVEDVCRQVVNEIIEILKDPLHRENRSAWFSQLFIAVKKNERYFRVCLDTYTQLMTSSVLETVCPPEGTDDHFRLVSREGAFIAVLTDWFRGGMKESPEYMGRLCDEIIPHGRAALEH